jgi:iron complex outermembrane receptor protein
LSIVAVSSVWASEKQQQTSSPIRQLSEIELPTTNAQLLVQSPIPSNPPVVPGSIVTITGVKANPTDKGVEVILETTLGEQLQLTNRSAGNNFIADIPNAQLRLPSGEAFTFRSEKPVEGITEITVTNIDANTVRVAVVGVAALPTVELFDDDAGLIFAVASTATATQPPQTPPTEEQPASETPAAQQDEPIELVVTGEQDSYRVPNASTATRTDTPLRDIPQSIQVVPQEVLRDQNVTTFNEALRNVPGVAPFNSSTTQLGNFIIRGFLDTNFANNFILRNGLREAGGLNAETTPDVERIEVFKGPASVLYGGAAPGGTINVVTKQPLRDPFYAIDGTIGSFDFYRGAIDLSGPLNDSRTVLYRLNASYQDRGSFIDFVERDQFTIAPVVSVAIGERTRFALEGEYTETDESNFLGLPAVGTVLPNPNGRIPRNRFVGSPDTVLNSQRSRVGYRLEHEFSDNWSLQNAFQARFFDRMYLGTNGLRIGTSLDPDNRTLNGIVFDEENNIDIYDLNVNLTGKFSIGSIEHQLVFGVDLGRYEQDASFFVAPAVPLDVFNPVYRPIFAGPYENVASLFNVTDTLGIYIQDQVTLASNLKLLLGGRFDLFEQTNQNLLTDTTTSQSGNAFSPRVGIVYQPIEPISVYASYSRSFAPVTGRSFEGDVFQPERGTQYEVGVKADLNERFSTTLALYELTRTGVTTADTRPGVPPGQFEIQTGEQRSRGIELSFQGEIMPGWNIIAGYAYTDARLTEDNVIPVGSRLNGVPENALNLWTTYEIQQGSLQGLGFGLGLFYVGGRQIDLDNSVELPSYLRTDAAIFYRRDRFRAALNFRNLFDVEYFESAFGQNTISYGEPFTVQGTISWQF